MSNIKQMTGGERKEHWRNQTLINRVSDNMQIAREYHTLVMFLKDNYKSRIETIQNPYLHLISHCLELSYKRFIEVAIEAKITNEDTINSHSHNLLELSMISQNLFVTISKLEICPLSEKQLIADDFCKFHQKISLILQTDITTYRYAQKISRKGEFKGAGHPFIKDYDSPNMLDIFDLFENCYRSLCYAMFLIDINNSI